MSEKIFGAIQTAEELNELANNLRKGKEFEEIRLLCTENNIAADIAEDFIKGNRLLLTSNGCKESSSEGESTTWNDVKATAEDKQVVKPEPIEKKRTNTVEDVKEKLEAELKIYCDGDSKYVVEKLINLCKTDTVLLEAIMLPHKSYDKAFQYFYQQSRNVGYKMPHGNMVYLDNDKAVELSVKYFKKDDSDLEKKKQTKTVTKSQVKVKTNEPQKKEKKNKPKDLGQKETMKIECDKPKHETNKKKGIEGQMSLFDF